MFAMYPRLHGMGVKGYEQTPDVVQILPERLGDPFKWRKPRRVFVNSMSDLFEPRVTYDFINKVFATMMQTPHHQYQILTKRPGPRRCVVEAVSGKELGRANETATEHLDGRIG